MNTIQIQLNERQLADLVYLMDEGLDTVSMRPSQHDDYSEEDLAELDRLCGDGISDVRRAIDARTYLWSSGCGYLELDIPFDAVEEIARPGDNEPAVRRWLEGEDTNYLRAQVEAISLNDIRPLLREAGVDEVGKMDEAELRRVLVHMACHDINNESSEED